MYIYYTNCKQIPDVLKSMMYVANTVSLYIYKNNTGWGVFKRELSYTLL